ncbi:HepT-like ribonuclease domain-containing protein [Aquiflexum gelatinilyticum]
MFFLCVYFLISHEYFNIKMTAVWEIIQRDLPKLKSMVTIILETEF